MKAFKKRAGNETGSAFVISILVLFMLSVLGMALMLTTTTETDISVNYRWGEMAFFNAEAALEYGKNVLAAHMLLVGDMSTALPVARADMSNCPQDGVGGTRDYQYSILDSVSNIRVCIGRVLREPGGGRLIQYDFRNPVGGDTRGDIDGDSNRDIQGTATVWIRRPIEGNIDRVENDRAILTAEGTAPNYKSVNTGRAVSVRRLEMTVFFPPPGLGSDRYSDITKGTDTSIAAPAGQVAGTVQ
jgi:hypothetical protein